MWSAPCSGCSTAGNSPLHQPNRRLGGSQSHSECCVEGNNSVPAEDQSTIHWLSSLKPSHYTEAASGYNHIHPLKQITAETINTLLVYSILSTLG